VHRLSAQSNELSLYYCAGGGVMTNMRDHHPYTVVHENVYMTPQYLHNYNLLTAENQFTNPAQMSSLGSLMGLRGAALGCGGGGWTGVNTSSMGLRGTALGCDGGGWTGEKTFIEGQISNNSPVNTQSLSYTKYCQAIDKHASNVRNVVSVCLIYWLC